MDVTVANHLLLGGIAVASFIVGLFFLRNWHNTRDRFYLLFAASFLVESVNRFALGFASSSEYDPLHYGVRTAAYALILVAIWDKNRAP